MLLFSLKRIAFVVLLSGTSSTVLAGWHEFCERSSLDFHRANAWPQPFVEQDRMASCSPFVLMAENGWIQQSTLTGFHFDTDSDELTEAGRMKVKQIVMEHPEPYRSIYLVPTGDTEHTDRRMRSVQDVLQLIGEGASSEVRLTRIGPRGMPADEVEAISVKLRSTVPDPRLPPVTSAGTTP